MAEEPSLPSLPAVTWDSTTETFSNSRKRVRRDNAAQLFANSSDPAVFSSDDDPALDNYVQGRRKKRYIGAWYSQHPASGDSVFEDDVRGKPAAAKTKKKKKEKRTLERQFDSGVWMGSDGTDGDDGLERLPDPKPRQSRSFHRVESLIVSSAEKVARMKIQDCIEEGIEDVDLSTLGLDSLSNATMEPLSQFSCIPVVAEGVAFEQKEPSMKLYLASNNLQRLPGAIFNIEHLTLLSLRGNGLVELPPAIGKLRNLEVLNVSQNSLRSLPFELLELLSTGTRLKELLLHPNPFYKPGSSADMHCSVSTGGNKAWKTPFHGEFVGRSPVQYSDTAGAVYSQFRLTTEVVDLAVATDDPVPSTIPYLSKSVVSSSIQMVSRVPTMLELALRSCYQTPQLKELGALLPADAPPLLHDHLKRALEQREAGGLTCSICGRAVIVPRSQWVEWWRLERIVLAGGDSPLYTRGPLSLDPEEQLVPFIRRGCSWRCVPPPISRATTPEPV